MKGEIETEQKWMLMLFARGWFRCEPCNNTYNIIRQKVRKRNTDERISINFENEKYFFIIMLNGSFAARWSWSLDFGSQSEKVFSRKMENG